MARRLSLLALAISACSPAATPEPNTTVAAKPAPKPVAPAAEPTRARWFFPDARGTAHAEVDLGANGVLQVGDHGRRYLVKDDEVQQASTLAGENLVDVRVEGTGLVLVGERGEVYLANAKDPLGPFVETRPGPKAKYAKVTAGKSALFALERGGALFRSTDAGGTWSQGTVPTRPGEVAMNIVADRSGSVLVLLHPQRLLLSTDDGATFAPIASPGIGASDILRDPKGALFLRGAIEERFARLVTSEKPGEKRFEIGPTPTPSAARVKADKPTEPGVTTWKELAGDRLVEITRKRDATSKKTSIAVSLAPLGAPAGPPSVVFEELVGLAYVTTAGYQNAIVVMVEQPSADPPTVMLRRTTDEGKTWETLGTFEGRIKEGFQVFAGPSWTAVGALCITDCKAPQVKIGGGAWAPLPLEKDLDLTAAHFDVARDRVWLVGRVGSEARVFAGSTKTLVLQRVAADLPSGRPSASTVDATGTLRLVSSGTLVRIGADLVQKPSLKLAEQLGASVSLAGEHGFAQSWTEAWETADGGEQWAKVAMGTTSRGRCALAGCYFADGTVRIGWDLPDEKRPLVASDTAPKPAKHATGTFTAPRVVSCTPKGPYKAVPEASWYTSSTAIDGDVRLMLGQIGEKSGHRVTAAKGAAATQTFSLLAPPPPSPKTARAFVGMGIDGMVAARFSFSTGGEEKYNPVDVELGWYSATAGKAVKAKLPKVDAFRVGRSNKNALLQPVRGGVLFMPQSGEGALHYLRDDGKITKMKRPPRLGSALWEEGIVVGERVVLAAWDDTAVALADTIDAGKTWRTAIWSIGSSGQLARIGDRAFVVVGARALTRSEPTMLLSLDQLGNDPPAAIVIDETVLDSPAKAKTCTGTLRTGFHTILTNSGGGEVTVEIAGDKGTDRTLLTAVDHVVRVAADGTLCLDGIEASEAADAQGGTTVSLVLADPDHAWAIRRSDSEDRLDVRPIACSSPP